MMGPASPASGPATRCGFVALVGRPNAGKSTLVNALVGESLAMVSPRAQSTQRATLGILTRGDAQLLFLDTPGVLLPRDPLQKSLLQGARAAVREADVVVLLADPTVSASREERALLLDTLSIGRGARLGVVGKVDRADSEAVEREVAWVTEVVGGAPHRISAQEGRGLDGLLEALAERLPEGPFLYPEDELSSEPVRFFVAERVREVLFEQFRDEVPYAAFCTVEAFREAAPGERTYIQVTIHVEKPSQKGILLGEGGRAIRALGTVARERIEHFLGEPVYLDLWVKVLPNWRRKRAQLRRFGFPDPEDDVGRPKG